MKLSNRLDRLEQKVAAKNKRLAVIIRHYGETQEDAERRHYAEKPEDVGAETVVV